MRNNRKQSGVTAPTRTTHVQDMQATTCWCTRRWFSGTPEKFQVGDSYSVEGPAPRQKERTCRPAALLRAQDAPQTEVQDANLSSFVSHNRVFCLCFQRLLFLVQLVQHPLPGSLFQLLDFGRIVLEPNSIFLLGIELIFCNLVVPVSDVILIRQT